MYITIFESLVHPWQRSLPKEKVYNICTAPHTTAAAALFMSQTEQAYSL